MRVIPTKPFDFEKMFGKDNTKKEILDKIGYIDEHLNCNYIFKTITFDKWVKTYKPLILKIVDNPICDGNYNKLMNYLEIFEQDLLLKENLSMDKLEDCIAEDFGKNMLENHQILRK